MRQAAFRQRAAPARRRRSARRRAVQREIREDRADDGHELEAVAREAEGMEEARRVRRGADDRQVVRRLRLDAAPAAHDAHAAHAREEIDRGLRALREVGDSRRSCCSRSRSARPCRPPPITSVPWPVCLNESARPTALTTGSSSGGSALGDDHHRGARAERDLVADQRREARGPGAGGVDDDRALEARRRRRRTASRRRGARAPTTPPPSTISTPAASRRAREGERGAVGIGGAVASRPPARRRSAGASAGTQPAQLRRVDDLLVLVAERAHRLAARSSVAQLRRGLGDLHLAVGVEAAIVADERSRCRATSPSPRSEIGISARSRPRVRTPPALAPDACRPTSRALEHDRRACRAARDAAPPSSRAGRRRRRRRRRVVGHAAFRVARLASSPSVTGFSGGRTRKPDTSPGKPSGEGLAGQVLQDDVGLPGREGVEVQHLDDVGVPEPRGDLRFPTERWSISSPPWRWRRRSTFTATCFAGKSEVLRRPHRAHAAAPDESLDTVGLSQDRTHVEHVVS